MHRARTGRTGCLDDLRAVGITVDADAGVGFGHMRTLGVGVGVDRDGADTETSAGRENTAGDLATVGDQNTGDHGMLRYIRKTPKFDAPWIGPLAIADRHIPSTVRVSRGSMTPSS